MKTFDNETVRRQILKYQIPNQYRKACGFLEAGQFSKVQLKLRRPKQKNVWQFRITRKYQAFAFRKNGDFYIFEISDHQ